MPERGKKATERQSWHEKVYLTAWMLRSPGIRAIRMKSGPESTLANVSVFFNFKGVTSHAAAAPELGRSALDAAELMSVGVNYLREHIIS